jgi:hypothetical protein
MNRKEQLLASLTRMKFENHVDAYSQGYNAAIRAAEILINIWVEDNA